MLQVQSVVYGMPQCILLTKLHLYVQYLLDMHGRWPRVFRDLFGGEGLRTVFCVDLELDGAARFVQLCGDWSAD